MTTNINHVIDVRIYYEDTDAAGIVYHASYLRFAERGRTELLRDSGFSHAELLKQSGVAFAVVSMQVDFRAPAKLDDLLSISSRISRVGGASLDMEQHIRRGTQDICNIKLKLACLDKNMKSVRLPDAVRRLFKNIQ